MRYDISTVRRNRLTISVGLDTCEPPDEFACVEVYSGDDGQSAWLNRQAAIQLRDLLMRLLEEAPDAR